MDQASEIARKPDSRTRQIAEHVALVAESAGSYAYQFVKCADGSYYEVRVSAPGVPAVISVVDPQGRPLNEPKPVEPPQPMIMTANGLAPAPTPEPEPEPERRRRWKLWRR